MADDRSSPTRPRRTRSTRRTRTVVRRLAREARERGSRMSLHLAEHAAERRFLEHGDGPIPGWYESRLKLRRDLLEWPGKSPVALADDLGALGPHGICVHLTDARPEELELRRAPGGAGRLLPALEPVHRDAPAAAARGARRRDPAGARDRLARVERVARRARRGARAGRSLLRPCRRASSSGWRRGRARARSAATTSGASRAARGRASSRSTATRATIPCAFVLRNVRAPRRWVVRRRGERSDVVSVLARVRTYGSLVAFSHTVFAMPFAASAVVLSLAVPHEPLTALRVRRDGRVHGLRADERDGVQPLGRPRRRREEPAHPRRGTSRRATVRAGEALALAVVSGLAFLAVAATLGFWPAVLAPGRARGPARLLVREALHVGRARLARRRALARAGRRVARDGRAAGAGHRAAHGRRGHVAPRLRRPLLAPGRGLRPRRGAALDPGPLRQTARAWRSPRAPTS